MKKIFVIGMFAAIAASAADRTATVSKEQAMQYRAEAQKYAAMADEYDRNPASHPIPKYPNFGQHCRTLSRQYLAKAQKAEAQAR